MKTTRGQKNMRLRTSLALYTGVVILLMGGGPALADLTCTNIHEAEVSVARECRGLQAQRDDFYRFKEYLKRTYVKKSLTPRNLLERYQRDELSLQQKERWCQDAQKSHAILAQMAKEQGLNCDQDQTSSNQSIVPSTVPTSPGNNNWGNNQNSNTGQYTGTTWPQCPDPNNKPGMHRHRVPPNSKVYADCSYFSDGRLRNQTVWNGNSREGTWLSYVDYPNSCGRVLSTQKTYKNGTELDVNLQVCDPRTGRIHQKK